MAKETKPQTYRVSNEVDAELRQLAKRHGGIDKALRVLMEWEDPAVEVKPLDLRKALGSNRCPECDRMAPGHSMTCVTGNQLAQRRQLGTGRGLRQKGDGKR